MALFDLLGRRWTLRILWELSLATAPLTFRALQDRCDGISSSVLSQRLAELREARLLADDRRGYALSSEGAALVEALGAVTTWAEAWAAGFA
ncbi:MAG TPA: winged helix-turn-helix transcriptional regulator [Capillimicrobium sp.]|nr:winged helix-turn-helix transcriptional regulator [Capillimicrobium sp.]